MNYIVSGLSFLAGESTKGLAQCQLFDDTVTNNKFLAILKIARVVVQILQILVPIALIVWGTLDFGKAVIEGDEKKMKEKRKPFIQRIISAVIVFLIPWIVGIILSNVGAQEWKDCWKWASKANLDDIRNKNGTAPYDNLGD